MKTTDLPTKWWHRLALTVFWSVFTAAALCFCVMGFVIFRGGLGSHDWLEMGYTAAAALVAPAFVWGLYRLVLWIVVGRLIRDDAHPSLVPPLVSEPQLALLPPDEVTARRHYILTRGVLGYGLPFLAIICVYRFYFDESCNYYSRLGELIVLVPGSIVLGYLQGRRMWRLKQKQAGKQQ